MSNGYQPDTRQRLQRATRFFARLGSFDLECPHCGDVYQVRVGAARQKSTMHQNWNPETARFRCTNKLCNRQYILGIVAWPVSGGKVGTATPEDQVPSPRQLAQMRKEGGGWWLADEAMQRYQKPSETNVTTEEDRPDRDDDDE